MKEHIGFTVAVEEKQLAQSQEAVQQRTVLSVFVTLLGMIALIGMGIYIGYIIWGNKNSQSTAQNNTQDLASLLSTTTPSGIDSNTNAWTSYTDVNFSIKYPASWVVKKAFSTKDDVLLYDPQKIKVVTQNGQQGRLPSVYVDIVQITNSATESASQMVDDYKNQMQGKGVVVQTEKSPTLRDNLALVTTGGTGNSIFLTNANMLAVFNTSLQHLTDLTTENRILQTFQFIKQ